MSVLLSWKPVLALPVLLGAAPLSGWAAAALGWHRQTLLCAQGGAWVAWPVYPATCSAPLTHVLETQRGLDDNSFGWPTWEVLAVTAEIFMAWPPPGGEADGSAAGGAFLTLAH